jgi:hypothetical protein
MVGHDRRQCFRFTPPTNKIHPISETNKSLFGFLPLLIIKGREKGRGREREEEGER